MENKSQFFILLLCAIFGGIYVDIYMGNILSETTKGFISENSIPLYTIIFVIGVGIMFYSTNKKQENE